MGKRMLARLGAAVAGGALAFTMAAPALADHPQEEVETTPDSTVVRNQPSSTPVGASENEPPESCTAPLTAIKLDAGPGSVLDGAITIAQEGDPKHYKVTTNGTVVLHAVYLGGGGNHAEYLFNPPVTSANNLWVAGPAAAGGEAVDLSHTWFCYGPPPTTPPPTTPPPTTPPAETTPPVETTPPGENGELPVTGSVVGAMLVLAGGLLAAGITMLLVRRRRSLADLMEG
jgi:LPXTG-motif cell wall-anchored protein